MNAPAVGSLADRVDRLERQNRRLKHVGAAVAIGIATVVLMGQARTAAKVVEAERFIVRDAGGRTRATLGVAADGEAGLYFVDRDGKLRAALALKTDGGPNLTLLDRDEKPRVGLVVGADGTPVLGLFDRDKKLRATLSVAADGTPFLSFKDRDGKVIGWDAP